MNTLRHQYKEVFLVAKAPLKSSSSFFRSEIRQVRKRWINVVGYRAKRYDWVKKFIVSRPCLACRAALAPSPGPAQIFSKKQYVGCSEGRRRGSPQSCWESQRSRRTHVAKLFNISGKNPWHFSQKTIDESYILWIWNEIITTRLSVILINQLYFSWGYWNYIFSTHRLQFSEVFWYFSVPS